MYRKTISKYILVFVILAFPLFSERAFAKIPFKAFKGVTRCFKINKTHYSPIFGEAILESGFIYDLRFYGNYRPSYKEDGSRHYVKDASEDDPVWHIVHILFPSVGGALGTDSTAKSNFGQYVTDPKTIASLLNFTNDYRENRIKLKEKGDKSFIQDWKTKISATLNNAPRLARKTSGDLVDQIIKSIDDEVTFQDDKDVLYPKYTTEHILSSFFCYKFSTQADIWNLLENLDDSIVNKTSIPKAIDEWKYEDLVKISKKSKAYDPDEILTLLTSDTWCSPTPYWEGSPPLSNGKARKYDRENDQYIGSETFADCVEITARHLMNLLLYNPKTKQFDLTNIRNYVSLNSPDNPFFKNFESFYEKQTLSLSNAGDIEMRSLWNRVVADLNNGPDMSFLVQYDCDDNNELSPGFINLLKVFQKVFGLKISPIPVRNLDDKKKWLEGSLKELFKALNPSRAFSLRLDKLYEGSGDISGKLPIIVGQKEGNDEFSFTLISQVGKHSEIIDLKNLIGTKELESFTSHLGAHPIMIKGNTAEESLWLLSSDAKLKESKAHFLLYILFSQGLLDNQSRINFLKKFKANFNTWEMDLTKSSLIAFKTMLGNVLEDISWQDQEILASVSPLALELIKRPGLEEVLIKNVKGMKIKTSTRLSEVLRFKSLEYLFLNELRGIEALSLKELSQLRTLYLSVSDLKKIHGMDELKELEILSLSYVTGLEELLLSNFKKLKKLFINELSSLRNDEAFSLKGLDQLRSLDLSNLKVKNIHGIDELKELEILRLSDITGLEELSLESFQKLKDLSIYRLSAKKIKGFDALINLEKFKLDYTDLDEIFLRGLPELKDVSITNLNVKTAEFSNLQSLIKIFLCHVKELEVLYLKNLQKLETINLRSLQITKIEGLSTLDSLQEITLAYMVYLNEFSIKNGSKKLKEISLESCSNLKEVDLSGIENLKKLGLAVISGLDVVSLKNLPNVRSLDLYRSKVKQVEGSEMLESLEKLNLTLVKELNEFSLEKGSKKLKYITFASSNVKKIKISNLEALEELNLKDTKDLQTASLSGLDKLRTLSLEKSAVKTLVLENLKSIEELKLCNLGLSQVIFNGEFPNLKKLSFKNSTELEEVLGLECLKGLEKLKLRGTSKLCSITLAQEHEKLEVIGGNGIQIQYVSSQSPNKIDDELDELM